MKTATGVVVDGKIAVEGASFPEGTQVVVFTSNLLDVTVLSPEEEADLLDALAAADREEGLPARSVLEHIRAYD